MEYVLPNDLADSFAIGLSRFGETARFAFETLMWSEGISEGSELDDSVVKAVLLSVADFLSNPMVAEIVDLTALPPEFLGTNMILSGNHHGTGFWDTNHKGVTEEQLEVLHHSSIPIEVYADADGTYYAL